MAEGHPFPYSLSKPDSDTKPNAQSDSRSPRLLPLPDRLQHLSQLRNQSLDQLRPQPLVRLPRQFRLRVQLLVQSRPPASTPILAHRPTPKPAPIPTPHPVISPTPTPCPRPTPKVASIPKELGSGYGTKLIRPPNQEERMMELRAFAQGDASSEVNTEGLPHLLVG
jgi:hypothetical protein